MGFFDELSTVSWADNTIKVNIINPRTGDVMMDGDRACFLEFKSTESNEWKAQVEETAKRSRNRKSNDITIEDVRMSECRALASVAVCGHVPDYTESFTKEDLQDNNNAQKIRSQLRRFLMDVYPFFTSEVLEKMNDSTLFMIEPEKGLEQESNIEGGVQATQADQSSTSQV